MNDDSFSAKLRNLSKDYYQKHISFEEYRVSRKSILDQIDEEFNGQIMQQQPDQPEEPDTTSIFMKTISFFQNIDLNEKKKSD